MGVLSDLLASPKSFSRKVNAELDRQVAAGRDQVISAAAAANAVHTLAQSSQTSGNFTLTIELANGESFTTGSIAFNAAAAAVESAIDTAATSAAISGWTNGDISVSGGAVNAAAVVITFDGSSVAGSCPVLTVLADVDGAGGAWGAITRTTAGQSQRNGWGALVALGAIATPLPTQREATAQNVTEGPRLLKVPTWLLKELAQEASVEDADNGTYHAIAAILNWDGKAPLVPLP
jgi:hypothetical protein